MVPPSARSLVFLADTAFRWRRWTQFISYFSSRSFSCYASDLAANTRISYDKNAVPAEPSHSPLHSPTDLLKTIAADQKVFFPQAPLVLLSAAPTAAAAIALARQQDSPIGAVAILHPPLAVVLYALIADSLSAAHLAGPGRLSLHRPGIRFRGCGMSIHKSGGGNAWHTPFVSI